MSLKTRPRGMSRAASASSSGRVAIEVAADRHHAPPQPGKGGAGVAVRRDEHLSGPHHSPRRLDERDTRRGALASYSRDLRTFDDLRAGPLGGGGESLDVACRMQRRGARIEQPAVIAARAELGAELGGDRVCGSRNSARGGSMTRAFSSPRRCAGLAASVTPPERIRSQAIPSSTTSASRYATASSDSRKSRLAASRPSFRASSSMSGL